MGPGMFDGIVPALISIGVVLGLVLAGVIWTLATYVFPHMHWQ